MVSPKMKPHHSSNVNNNNNATHYRTLPVKQQPYWDFDDVSTTEQQTPERKQSRRIQGTRFEVITRADPPATFKNYPATIYEDSMADIFNANSRQHLTFSGNDGAGIFAETIRRLSLLPIKFPVVKRMRSYSAGVAPSTSSHRGNENCGPLGTVKNFFGTFRFATILILTPMLFSPLLLFGKSEYKCAFCVAVMAVYWMSEILPLAITALLPVVLFPMMGILPAKAVAREFINDANLLMMGGLIIATAVEKCQLHERLALRVLTLVGSNPPRIMFGFMLVTAFLSMFISNTATAAMMAPIAQSVIQQLMRSGSRGNLGSDVDLLEVEAGQLRKSAGSLEKPLSKKELRIAKGLILSICFASNIGGTGTLTGTPPNLVMTGMLPALFPHMNLGVNFLSWMAFAVPLMCLLLVACFITLCLFFVSFSSPFDNSVNKVMKLRYNSLSKMSCAEKSVSALFLLLIFLWIGRDPQCFPGFDVFFPKGFYTDGTSAILVSILLFMLPTKWPSFEEIKQRLKSNGENEDKHLEGRPSVERLMDWPTMQKQFPWSIIFLLGGGFALALGVKESGLSALIGNGLAQLQNNPSWALQVICIAVTMIVTNICSNTVTASIFIPIVATMAQQAGLHPLALMLPTTLACSFAFMLPVGTPSNTIAFASGLLQAKDMILSGLVVSIVTAVIMVLYLAYFSHIIFPGIGQAAQLLPSLSANLTEIMLAESAP